MQKYFLLLFIAGHVLATQAQVQVAVKSEPRHHNLFENEYVRVLDVHIKPGDTTLVHIHSTPSAFLSITRTTTGAQVIGQSPGRSTSVPGRLSYDSLGTPRVHHVWNEDTSWFHVMDIEFPSKKIPVTQPGLNDPLLKQAFNRRMASGYNAQLQPGNVLQLPAPSIGYLIVSITDTDINYTTNKSTQHRFMKPGHLIWVEAGESFSITANTNASLAILQLK